MLGHFCETFEGERMKGTTEQAKYTREGRIQEGMVQNNFRSICQRGVKKFKMEGDNVIAHAGSWN